MSNVEDGLDVEDDSVGCVDVEANGRGGFAMVWRLRDEDVLLVDDRRDDEDDGFGFDRILGLSCLAGLVVAVDDRCESGCCIRGCTRANMSTMLCG